MTSQGGATLSSVLLSSRNLNRVLLLGDSGGVVNSLDFCPASLKSAFTSGAYFLHNGRR